MPAARDVEVLMTILCWTMPGADCVLVAVAEDRGV